MGLKMKNFVNAAALIIALILGWGFVGYYSAMQRVNVAASPIQRTADELPPAVVVPTPEPMPAPSKFLPMNFEMLRRDRSFYVFDAKKSDGSVRPWNGRYVWTWKDDGRKTTIRFEGLDEKRLTKCVVSVAGADPNQPTVDMVLASGFMDRILIQDAKVGPVTTFWYTDPLPPVSKSILGVAFSFAVDNGVSSIIALPD